jgi:hypothetical protein
MRLSADKIKAAILDPDVELREAAVYYFSGSHSADPTIMPLVIGAFERLGLEAFASFEFLVELVQTAESVAWLCREIKQVDPAADEMSDDFLANCEAALRAADASALMPHEAAIQKLRRLEPLSKIVVAYRIRLSTCTLDALWQELAELCESSSLEEMLEPSDEEYDFGCAIADALSLHPDQCIGQILDTLMHRDGASDWLEFVAARVAGQLRLEAAIPHLVDRLDDLDSIVYGQALWALKRIGSDAVVRELASRYDSGDVDLRFEIACLLEDIHSDLCISTGLDLLGREQDQELRGMLIRSVLMNYESDGIELARQYVLSAPNRRSPLEFLADLVLVSRMLGVSFPEFELWAEAVRFEQAHRREWDDDNSVFSLMDESLLDEFDDDSSWVDEESDEVDYAIDDRQTGTIIHESPKIGRNDLCPCGSGRKYKKCCLNKQAPR